MGSGIGLATVIGTGEEIVYGTPVAIDKRHAFLPGETLVRNNTILEPQGITGDLGFVRRGAGRVLSTRDGSGDLTMEVAKAGMGRWFKHMLGGVSTITQQGLTTAWKQTHQVGDLLDRSLTLQQVLRDGAGTAVGSFLFHGGKINEWELTVEVGSIPSLRVGMDFEDVEAGAETAAILALPAPSAGNFTFREGSLTVEGAPIANVTAATVNGSNSLRTDAYSLGTSGLKVQPQINDYRPLGGQLTAEFSNTADVFDRFVTDEGVELVLLFTGDIIAGSFAEELKITMPEIHFTGSKPNVAGAGVIEQPAPFTATHDGTNPAVTIEYTSTDTTIT
jgi:hypothetical protein